MGMNHLRAITEAAQAMHMPPDVAAVTDEIVVQAPRLVPEFEHVCLSLVGPNRALETLAATTELAARLDALQATTGEGPCLDAILEESTVVVQDARHEQRWPNYTRQAVKLGLRLQIAVRLQGQDKRLIGLNLYSTSYDEFNRGSVGVAEHFATHAGLALNDVRREEQLQTAIGTRTIIGAAIGVAMERYGLTQAEAFAYLVRQSSTQNQKLRIVAKDLVDETEEATRSGKAADGKPLAPGRRRRLRQRQPGTDRHATDTEDRRGDRGIRETLRRASGVGSSGPLGCEPVKD